MSGAIKNIHHRTKEYSLKAGFQLKEENDKKEESINIWLKILSTTKCSVYHANVTNQNSPRQLLNNFVELQIYFDCMREISNCQITNQGQLTVSIETEMCGRKIIRKGTIIMQEHELTETERIMEHLSDLQEQIQDLKREKEDSENLIREQYNKKMQEEKKKFSLIIEKKEIQNKKVKQKYQQMKEQIIKMRNQVTIIKQKYQKFNHQSALNLQKTIKKNKKQGEQLQKAQQQIVELTDLLRQSIGRKILKREKQNTPQPHKQSISQLIITQKMQNQAECPKVEQRLQKNSPHYQKFHIFNDVIEYKSQDQFSQILFRQQINRKGKKSFKFEILKTSKRNIRIGVTQKLEGNVKRFNFQKSLSYLGKTGYISGLNKIEGEGFQQNSFVEMIVQIQAKKIIWKVNEHIEAQIQSQILNDDSIKMVPYIEMGDYLDAIRFIDEFQ